MLWQNGVWSSSVESIVGAFNRVEPAVKREALKERYGIRTDRPSSCKIGALDFITDYKFVLPAEYLVRQGQMAGMAGNERSISDVVDKAPAFRCIVYEPNPWQISHRAHHAVDLLLLFPSFEMSMGPSAERSGHHMREKFIDFIIGRDPWQQEKVAAFGPYGMYQTLDNTELNTRRRVQHLELLRNIETSLLDQVFLELAGGRISLMN